MPAFEFIQEAKYDYPIADYEATPPDPGFEHIVAGKNKDEPHIGPQEGKYLNLMLRGIKPAAILCFPTEKALFAPYIKDGTIKLVAKHHFPGSEEYDYWYVTLPGEEWRGTKLEKLFYEDPKDEKAEKILHAKVGRLLGIPKESVRFYLKTRY